MEISKVAKARHPVLCVCKGREGDVWIRVHNSPDKILSEVSWSQKIKRDQVGGIDL